MIYWGVYRNRHMSNFNNHKFMKKKLFPDSLYNIKITTNYLLIMKLAIILLLIGSLQSMASIYSQNTMLNISLNDKTIKDVFREIEQQSEFHFLYNDDFVDLDRVVSLSMKESKVEDILLALFEKADVTFKVLDNNLIVITPAGFLKTQQQRITGTVIDATTNEPLPGVNIVIEGTNTGVVTDINGKYSITVPDQNSVLLFSYVGYVTERVSVEGKVVIDISMVVDIQNLEEVVVVGYGVMRKRDVLGAISSVKADDVSLSTSSSIASALEGKAAGLMIQQNSAQPGGGLDISIRGRGSVNASNDPLIVVDGFPISELDQPGSGNRYDAGTTSILNSFNPNDIESVEVLKDASSTAIYGARAANGVILITTKRGKEGKPRLEYSTNFAYQKYENSFDVLPLNEWMQVRNEAAWEDWNFQNRVYPYGTRTLEEAQANPVGADFHTLYTQHAIDNVGRGTDWFDLVTRNGSIQQHNISLNGGTESTKYLLSGNFYDHRGIIKNSGIKRYSFRTNIDQKINNFIKLGLSLTGSRIMNDNSQLGEGPWENSGIIRAAIQQGPHILAIDEEGNYPLNPQLATQPNPYSLLTITDKGRVDRMLVNAFLDITPVKDWNIKLKAGLDRGVSNRWSYLPKTTMAGALENGRASISEIDNNDYLLEVTSNYTKTFFEHHRVIFLVGANQQKTHYNYTSVGNTNFITDAFLWNNLNAGTGTKTESSSRTENMIASYFGRVFYNFHDRYLVTFSIRTDGASVFSKNHKWATFPSVSVGWNVAEESFFSNYKNAISQFKLRFGYGQTGNATISSNAFASYYAYPGWVSGNDQPLIAVSMARLENPDLKWETTTESNFGVDFSMLKGLFSGSFDIFNRVISDLLAVKQINSYHEINSIISNIGKTQSKGFEFTLTSAIFNRSNFTWNSTLNLSRFKDNWKERAPDWKPAVYESDHDPIRPIYSRIANGIMQVDEIVPEQPELIPGQIKIKDIDGYQRDDLGNPAVNENGRFIRTGEPDGIIDDADTKLIGTSDPKFIGGLSNSFTYKNINLNFHFNGMFGRKLEDPNEIWYGVSADGLYTYGYNALRTVKNRWTPDKPSTTRPSSFYGWSPYGSGDLFLQDAWFIRLQNISLGYTIPKKWLKNIAAFTVHVDADNLFVITPYKGVDPETDSYTAAYPYVRTYTLGLNVKF
jgi:TonB-linked SusC/RagA family outer membrane protein